MTTRNHLWLAALGLAFAVPGCSAPGGPAGSAPDLGPGLVGGDDGGDNVDPGSDEALTTLVGLVRDAYGMPVAGATVSTLAGQSVVTGDDGKFRFDDVEPEPRMLVNVRKEGYAHAQTPLEIFEDVENTVIQTLAEVDLITTFDAAAGVDISLGNGEASVALPGSNFVDEDGNAYAGEVTAEVTWFDLDEVEGQGNELQAIPGDFTASRFNGDQVSLESFGMLQVNLYGADGADLELAGETAPLRFPITDVGSADVPVLGETVPAWSYDESTGLWVEEGQGTVVQDADGQLVWEFAAPHFSTWNVDKPLPTHGCISGRLMDPWGTPRAGAIVRLIGQTYIATTTARTGQDGTFCAEGKNGETAFIEFQYTVNNQTATQRTDPVTIPAG